MTGTYSADLLTALLWLVGTLGALLVCISGYFARQVLANQKTMASSIETNQQAMAASMTTGFTAVKESIDTEVRALRELFHSIDKRVMELEFRAKLKAGEP